MLRSLPSQLSGSNKRRTANREQVSRARAVRGLEEASPPALFRRAAAVGRRSAAGRTSRPPSSRSAFANGLWTMLVTLQLHNQHTFTQWRGGRGGRVGHRPRAGRRRPGGGERPRVVGGGATAGGSIQTVRGRRLRGRAQAADVRPSAWSCPPPPPNWRRRPTATAAAPAAATLARPRALSSRSSGLTAVDTVVPLFPAKKNESASPSHGTRRHERGTR